MREKEKQKENVSVCDADSNLTTEFKRVCVRARERESYNRFGVGERRGKLARETQKVKVRYKRMLY